jgi:hypothetical protein
MGILNVNKIQPVGSGQTVTISASDINLQASSITANTFSGNVTGNIISSGISTFSSGIVVSSGSASSPSISPSGDSNTGIFFPEPDTVAIGEGGTEVLRVNSSGNVGINSTSPQTKLDVVGGINGTLVLDTAKTASGLGTSVDFTGIPSWVKRVTVMFNGVSTNGSSQVLIQIGTFSGAATTGYLSSVSAVAGSANNCNTNSHTNGFAIVTSQQAGSGNALNGLSTVCTLGSNVWAASGNVRTAPSEGTNFHAGTVTLSGTLDRIRITTVNGTDTFDAGTINIMYEG